MLKIFKKTIIERLIFVFQICINVKYYSKLFRITKTIMLKKVEKKTIIFRSNSLGQ